MTDDLSLPLRRELLFALGVQAIADRFPGASCTSWGRSVKHNQELGGKAASQHLTWTAADLAWDAGAEPDPGLLVAVARERGLEAYREGDHWHLELFTTLY